MFEGELDEVLKFLSDSEKKNITFVALRNGINHKYTHDLLQELLNKLIKEGHVKKILNTARREECYRITFKGEVFIRNGGHAKKKRNFKVMYFVATLLTVVNVFATIIWGAFKLRRSN
jgi:predicted transcriptional regulator